MRLIAWWQPIIGIAVYSLNHWLVAIGLSSQVSGHAWLFVPIMLLVGTVGFLWLIPTPGGTLLRVVPIVICTRLALGFVHFLYDRWVWRLSAPEVRVTIGCQLFASHPLAVPRQEIAGSGSAAKSATLVG